MTTPQPLDIRRAPTSFYLALRAENKSPGTIELYSVAVREFTALLEAEGHSSEVGEIARDAINAYLAELHKDRLGETSPTILQAGVSPGLHTVELHARLPRSLLTRHTQALYTTDVSTGSALHFNCFMPRSGLSSRWAPFLFSSGKSASP
jgi:hypothetical protein